MRDFLNLPKGGSGARPGVGSRPGASQLPALDRGKIRDSIGVGAGPRPSMPDWFQPGASQLPTQRPGGDRPLAKTPGGDRPPVAKQRPAGPGSGDRPTRPPGAEKPPSGDRPGRPPGAEKPPAGKIPGRPPGAERPPGKPPGGVRPPGKPPGTRPPGRPPGVRPPARPPVVRPPVGRPWPPRPWHPWHPGHGGYRPGYWWRWATAGAITGWIAHRWTSPVYYSYGSGGTVYYENNVVYVNGEEYGSAEAYYEEASKIATSAPELTDEQAEQVEWLPLGVFALTTEGVNASSMFLQLAVSKDGILAGTFYNETTGAVHPVEGTVDPTSQRAVWKAADGTNPDLVMETGVYNLTQDRTDVLVHFGPEQTQTWVMVRLDESERPESDESGPR